MFHTHPVLALLLHMARRDMLYAPDTVHSRSVPDGNRSPRRVLPNPAMRQRAVSLLCSVLLPGGLASSAACARNGSGDLQAAAPAAGAGTGSATANRLTAAEQADGWRLLFDGRTTAGWRGYRQAAMPNGWRVENGTLTKPDATEDILTTEQFGDFELAIDWLIGPGGNSGIFYRGSEEFERVYWSAPEYQLLDDATARDGRNRLTSAASAYGLYAAPAGILKPAGDWNTTRIIARGARVEHWLNGQKVVQYELWSPDWEAKVKASKFSQWPKYGRGTSGHIAIQGDHEGVLALRNIKIRTLP
jgi:hypothetical protein